MQQIKPVQTIQPVGQLPAPEKSTNKPIYPVQTTNKQEATMTGNIDREGFGFDGSGTSSGIGLLGKAQYSKDGTEPIYHTTSAPNPVPPKPGASQTGGKEGSAWTAPKPTESQATNNPATPVADPNAQYQVATPQAAQSSFVAKDFQSDANTGVTSNTQYQYDPRNESLVQNQITGLLDPNSDIMRKAQAQAQGYNAARGLQSSSIGNEVALSSMIDKALPIAQQDAQTYNQAQSQQWQTQAQLDQANLKNQQEASMADKQGAINNQLQNNQMEWQTGEKNTDRQFQTQLEDLKYKQQLGTLDKQQSLQLAQMERSAQIQTDRDAILQQYQVQLNDLQNDQRWKELTAQIDANFETQTRSFDQQTKMEYGNAQSTAVNAAMQAIGMAMSNPNMTAEQQKAAIANIVSTLQSQANMLSVIYGASSATPPPLVTPPASTGNTGSTSGSTGTTGNTGSTGTTVGGGGSGGGTTRPAQQQR